jgi:flagellar biogenesis protein FliO
MPPPETPETPKVPETPVVSPARRSAGTLIAIALLTLLVIGAAWFVMRSTRSVTERTGTSAPRP